MKVKFVIFICISLLPSCVSKEKQVLKHSQDSTELLTLKSSAYELFNSKKYLEAKKQLSLILAIDSTDGEVFYKRGFCNAKISKCIDSTKDFQNAIKYDYRIDDAYFNIGINYERQMVFTKAFYYYQKALEINPNHTKARIFTEYVRGLQDMPGNTLN